MEQYTINYRQELAIIALMEHPSITRAAKAAGVAESTLHRWLKEAEFQYHLKCARDSVKNKMMNKLYDAMGRAVDELVAIMYDLELPPNVRLNAAKTIMAYGMKSMEAKPTQYVWTSEAYETAVEHGIEEDKENKTVDWRISGTCSSNALAKSLSGQKEKTFGVESEANISREPRQPFGGGHVLLPPRRDQDDNFTDMEDGEENEEETSDDDGFTIHSTAIDDYIPALNGFARMGLGGMTASGFARRCNISQSCFR